MTITKFDPASLKTLRADIDAALATVAVRHGIALKAGKCSYDPAAGTATFAVQAAVLADGAPAGTDPADIKAAADWVRYCALFNLHPDWVGKTFRRNAGLFTILGLMPNRPKYPVRAKGPDGKVLLLTADEVQLRMRAAQSV